MGSLRHFVDDKTWTNVCESREDCAKLVRRVREDSANLANLAKLAKLPRNLCKPIAKLREMTMNGTAGSVTDSKTPFEARRNAQADLGALLPSASLLPDCSTMAARSASTCAALAGRLRITNMTVSIHEYFHNISERHHLFGTDRTSHVVTLLYNALGSAPPFARAVRDRLTALRTSI